MLLKILAWFILEVLQSVTTIVGFWTRDDSMPAVADGGELAVIIIDVEGLDSRLFLRLFFIVHVRLLLMLAVLLELDDL